MTSRRRPHTVSLAPALSNLRTGQTTRRRAGMWTGGVAGSRKIPVMSVPRHAPFGGMQPSFHHTLSPRAMLPCSSASGCRVAFPSPMIITKSHRI